jgi:hypothetical protein
MAASTDDDSLYGDDYCVSHEPLAMPPPPPPRPVPSIQLVDSVPLEAVAPLYNSVLAVLKNPLPAEEINQMATNWKRRERTRNGKKAQKAIDELIYHTLKFGNKYAAINAINDSIDCIEYRDMGDCETPISVTLTTLRKYRTMKMGDTDVTIGWIARHTDFCDQLAKCFGDRFKVIYRSTGDGLDELTLTLQFWLKF